MNKNKLELRIKALERGTTGATIKLNNENTGKKIEKYNPTKTNNGNYNTESEVQLTKKKQSRVEEDSEEEIVVKKAKKKQRVVEESESD